MTVLVFMSGTCYGYKVQYVGNPFGGRYDSKSWSLADRIYAEHILPPTLGYIALQSLVVLTCTWLASLSVTCQCFQLRSCDAALVQVILTLGAIVQGPNSQTLS